MSPYRTYREYLKHPVFLAAREIAMQRTGYRCHRCGAYATEVHHWNGYPAWDTFDAPSQLEPICHACHCLEHGKDD
jgi:hypothetical protein